jgi:1,4-dihydroxy-2-naphthoyl-CoA hydrolase
MIASSHKLDLLEECSMSASQTGPAIAVGVGHQDGPRPVLPDGDNGLDRVFGLQYLELTPHGGTAQLEIHEKLLQAAGIVHGGVYCSVIESLASMSGHAWLTGKGGGTVVGVNNNTDFLRAISAGTITAVSAPLHRGRAQQLWVVTITDDQDRLVARGQVRLQNLP